jgi:hypothetical protein
MIERQKWKARRRNRRVKQRNRESIKRQKKEIIGGDNRKEEVI